MNREPLSPFANMETDEKGSVCRSIIQHMDHSHDALIEEIKTVCRIPSPSFHEDKKAQYLKERYESIGLKDVVIDEHKNVIGRYPGKVSIARLALCSHIDTVFPEETVLKVVHDKKRLSCPGVGDNTTSVVSLIHMADAFRKSKYVPPFDILFIGNSCEEGLGDLKGMKGFMDGYATTRDDVELDVVLAIDGHLDQLCHMGVGSRRLKVTITAQGGHSWEAFGNSSAIHAIGAAVASINDIDYPKDPKTTYNIGVIEGGHSVNSIAENASMLVDIRSVDGEELIKTENEMRTRIDAVMTRFGTSVQYEIVGDRPTGVIPKDHPLVRIIFSTADKMGIDISSHASSTDANIPLNRGIPAATFGVYQGGGAHTKDEYIILETLKKGIPFAVSSILNVVEWIAAE